MNDVIILLYVRMEGDYLKLSKFLYNTHTFPYNSYPSPLETTGFLTNLLGFIYFRK